MRQVLLEDAPVPFLDAAAQELLEEARANFRRLGLAQSLMVEGEHHARVFPWAGDIALHTLAMLLRYWGLEAQQEGMCVLVKQSGSSSLTGVLAELCRRPLPQPQELAAGVLNKQQEKWDWLLPEGLLARNFAAHNLDLPAAAAVLGQVVGKT